jgi:hypothetical protein
MSQQPNDPTISDVVPTAEKLTCYDRKHFTTYLLLLDANAKGSDWRDVARAVFGIDSDREPLRARKTFESPSGERKVDD